MHFNIQCEGECGSISYQTAVWRCPNATDEAIFDCGLLPESHERTCLVSCIKAEEEIHIEDGTQADTSLSTADLNKSNNEKLTLTMKDREQIIATSNMPIDANDIMNAESKEYEDPLDDKVIPQSRTAITLKPKNRQRNYSTYWHRSSSSRTRSGNSNSRRTTLSSYHRRVVLNKNRNERPDSDIGLHHRHSQFRFSNPELRHIGPMDRSNALIDNECINDASKLCNLSALHHYCQLPGYRKLCCISCNMFP